MENGHIPTERPNEPGTEVAAGWLVWRDHVGTVEENQGPKAAGWKGSRGALSKLDGSVAGKTQRYLGMFQGSDECWRGICWSWGLLINLCLPITCCSLVLPKASFRSFTWPEQLHQLSRGLHYEILMLVLVYEQKPVFLIYYNSQVIKYIKYVVCFTVHFGFLSRFLPCYNHLSDRKIEITHYFMKGLCLVRAACTEAEGICVCVCDT